MDKQANRQRSSDIYYEVAKDAMGEIGELKAERDNLRAENERLQGVIDSNTGAYLEVVRENERLQKQINNFLTYGEGGANFQESQWIEKVRQAEEERDKWKQLSQLQDKLLVCYRIGKNPGSVLDKLRKARTALGDS